jgi:hypothetical protein
LSIFLQSRFYRAIGAAVLSWVIYAGPALSQDDSSDDDSSEGEAPSYLDEDIFGVEESQEEDEDAGKEEDPQEDDAASDLDFFDQLKIGTGEGTSSESDAPSIAGEDIQSLPSIGSRKEFENRDYSSFWDTAVFQALDKVTARIRIVEAPLQTPVTFERFEITVRQCNKRPPEETPNTTAFVEVDELKQDGERSDIFTGWMFASSPGLNAVEHPVYDVWLIDCKRRAPVTLDHIPNLEGSIDDGEDSGSENQSEDSPENATELAPGE